jgi:hypothetical protein
MGRPPAPATAPAGSRVPGLAQPDLGAARQVAHLAPMSSRIGLAALIGVIGFLLYVGAAVALADLVLPLHWSLVALYFLVAGIAWALPARALMVWAARGR